MEVIFTEYFTNVHRIMIGQFRDAERELLMSRNISVFHIFVYVVYNSLNCAVLEL